MLNINIFYSGEAFDDNPNIEVARILRNLADRFEAGNPPEVLHDYNGNQAGTVDLSDMDV